MIPSNYGFNAYSAGKKHYGGGRDSPNLGPTSSPEGYAERDRKAAVLRRMKALQKGKYMNPDVLRFLSR